MNFIDYYLYIFRIFLQILAMCFAYVCNNRSKKNNKYLMLFIAFLFPEYYLLQAGIRKYLLHDYKCYK